MPTNLAIDDNLLQEAQRIGGHCTKKATVTEALKEYIRLRKQARILELFGKAELAACRSTAPRGFRQLGTEESHANAICPAHLAGPGAQR